MSPFLPRTHNQALTHRVQGLFVVELPSVTLKRNVIADIQTKRSSSASSTRRSCFHYPIVQVLAERRRESGHKGGTFSLQLEASWSSSLYSDWSLFSDARWQTTVSRGYPPPRPPASHQPSTHTQQRSFTSDFLFPRPSNVRQVERKHQI